MASQDLQGFVKTDEGLVRTVGLISDTHVPDRAARVPLGVFRVFRDVDYIVHAGDLVRLSVLDELEQLAPVLAVCGNMDGPEIRGKLPRLNSLKVLDWTIGVTHNPGRMFGSGRMRQIAKMNGFNVLVYGHTHSSHSKWDGEILFINPGSPTNPSPPFLAKPTVALLRVTRKSIIPQIVPI